MPLKPPSPIPQTQRDWDMWARNVPVTPDNNSVGTIQLKDKQVTYAKIQDASPVSVIGNLQATIHAPGEITASGDNRFLCRRSGTLTFDSLADTDIPDTISRDSEVTAALAPYATQAASDVRYVLVSNVLSASATYDPPSLADGAGTTTTVTCAGCALGDFTLASFSLDLQGISMSAYVSSSDTVSVRFQNESGGTLDLASGTLRVRVWKQ